MKEFEPPSDEARAAYDAATRLGQIVQLKNGTNANQGELLNFENNHLVPWMPTGQIAAGEEARRHIGVYEWVTPKDGPYKGTRLCVSTSTRHGKYPPF